MPGEAFDVVLDEYLRLITRTRPWAKATEEDLLVPFADWLRACAHSHAAADDLLSLAATYAEQHAWTADDKQQLLAVLCRMLDWWHIAA